MRTTTWRRRGSEPGSGTEAQLWARPPLAAVGSVDQEPQVWRGACSSHPALRIQREERAGRPRLLAGLWRPGPFGGITALRGARGLGPPHLDGLSHAAVATLCAWRSGIREILWAGPLRSLPCLRPSPSAGHELGFPCPRVRLGALCGHHHARQAGSGCLLGAGPRSPDAFSQPGFES